MNIHDTSDELIDLGAASVETQGPGFYNADIVGRDPLPGISDE
jgi:hypothetical protein